MLSKHTEIHQIKNIGWLRAAVLGANDGIVSTASLILGVAASHVPHESVVIAGIAGLVSGSMAMATGEYVSVSSQADTEKAALNEERIELETDRTREESELAAIYVERGLDAPLAQQVAKKLMEHDAIGAHARDELGISKSNSARPLQAAIASALSFASGSALPLGLLVLVPEHQLIPVIVCGALVSLAVLGGMAARAGGARMLPGILRVTFWSAIALAVTAGVGALFGVK